MNEPREEDGGLQYHQEWQQFREEQELQDELEDYLNALFNYYGNQ